VGEGDFKLDNANESAIPAGTKRTDKKSWIP